MSFDHLDQPAWDRVFENIMRPWTDRLELLDGADAELRETERRARRLSVLDADLLHWARLRDEARREVVDLERRRKMAVDQAVEEAGQRAVLGRAKRMEAAREWAEELQEEQQKGQRRIATSRQTGAQRELDQRHEELRVIGTDPMYRDEQTLDWLAAVHEVVLSVHRRDKRARDMIATPWLQRRAIDEQLLRTLRSTVGTAIAPAATFAEGSVHVVGGGQFAIIEMREGGNDIRTRGDAHDRRLVEVTEFGERAAGVTNGSLAGLRAAATVVEQVTGSAPHRIICMHGWRQDPVKVDEVILCGPKVLAEVLQALPARHILPSDLDAVAAALAALPLPSIDVPMPASMEQLASIDLDALPHLLKKLRHLLDTAHSTVDIELREVVGARG